VAANGRRGRPQGKCHREETAGAGQLVQARVKRCGKSAPRLRQRRRHGKPHREQDRIGAARVREATLASSAILAAARVGCSRHGAIRAPEEWPSRRDPLQTEPGLQAGWQLLGPAFPEADAQRRLSGILPVLINSRATTRSCRPASAGKTPALRADALRPGTQHFGIRFGLPLLPRPFSWSYTPHKSLHRGHLTWRHG